LESRNQQAGEMHGLGAAADGSRDALPCR
jgi:hypothetical protein